MTGTLLKSTEGYYRGLRKRFEIEGRLVAFTCPSGKVSSKDFGQLSESVQCQDYYVGRRSILLQIRRFEECSV